MRKFLMIAVALVIGMVAGGVAWASIPHSTTGVITGCYNNSNGSLKVIDAQAGASCAGNETTLTWNQTGPVGPQGPAGLSGFEAVDGGLPPEISPGNTGLHSATCPTGKIAISGAFSSGNDTGDIYIFQSRQDSLNPGQWNVQAKNNGAVSLPAPHVIAYCAFVD